MQINLFFLTCRFRRRVEASTSKGSSSSNAGAGRRNEGCLRLNKAFILCLALSLCKAMAGGKLILLLELGVSSASSEVSSSAFSGLLLIFSVRLEMKIGALLPPAELNVFPNLNSCSLFRCLSLSLALKGSGLRSLKPEIISGTFSSSSSSWVSGSSTDELTITEDEDALAGLILELILDLESKLALFRFRTRELWNAGDEFGNTEDTGVAIKVGVTSLLVIMATVVDLDLKLIKIEKNEIN